MLNRIEAIYLGPWGPYAATRTARAAGVVLAVLLACFLSWKAVNNQITETQVLREDRVSLARYLDGTAFRPFAYRVFTPTLVNIAEHVLHVPAVLRMAPASVQEKFAGFCARATAQPPASCDGVVSYFAVAWGACLGFLLLIYAIVQGLFRNPLISLLGMGFAFLTVNAVLLARLSHIYDFSVLCGVSLLLLCLQRRWILLFTLLLPIAFATKETLVLYAGVGLIANLGYMEPRRNLALFLFQMACFVVVHGLIRWHFAGNAGFGHEYYLPAQISFFTEHIDLRLLLLMLFAMLLVFYDFPAKAEVLRRSSVVIIPWFVLFMIGGEMREVRVTFEILPLLILLAFDSLVRLLRGAGPRGALHG